MTADVPISVTRRDCRRAAHEVMYPKMLGTTPTERRRILVAGDRLYVALGGSVSTDSDGEELD